MDKQIDYMDLSTDEGGEGSGQSTSSHKQQKRKKTKERPAHTIHLKANAPKTKREEKEERRRKMIIRLMDENKKLKAQVKQMRAAKKVAAPKSSPADRKKARVEVDQAKDALLNTFLTNRRCAMYLLFCKRGKELYMVKVVGKKPEVTAKLHEIFAIFEGSVNVEEFGVLLPRKGQEGANSTSLVKAVKTAADGGVAMQKSQRKRLMAKGMSKISCMGWTIVDRRATENVLRRELEATHTFFEGREWPWETPDDKKVEKDEEMDDEEQTVKKALPPEEKDEVIARMLAEAEEKAKMEKAKTVAEVEAEEEEEEDKLVIDEDANQMGDEEEEAGG